MDLSEVLATVDLAPSMLAVIPVLIIIGFALKQTPIPNWSIVWILLALGTLLGFLIIEDPVEGVINGIIAGGMAIAAHQAYKQTVAQVKK